MLATELDRTALQVEALGCEHQQQKVWRTGATLGSSHWAAHAPQSFRSDRWFNHWISSSWAR